MILHADELRDELSGAESASDLLQTLEDLQLDDQELDDLEEALGKVLAAAYVRTIMERQLRTPLRQLRGQLHRAVLLHYQGRHHERTRFVPARAARRLATEDPTCQS